MLGAAFPILTTLPVIGWYTFGRFKSAMQKVAFIPLWEAKVETKLR